MLTFSEIINLTVLEFSYHIFYKGKPGDAVLHF